MENAMTKKLDYRRFTTYATCGASTKEECENCLNYVPNTGKPIEGVFCDNLNEHGGCEYDDPQIESVCERCREHVWKCADSEPPESGRDVLVFTLDRGYFIAHVTSQVHIEDQLKVSWHIEDPKKELGLRPVCWMHLPDLDEYNFKK